MGTLQLLGNRREHHGGICICHRCRPGHVRQQRRKQPPQFECDPRRSPRTLGGARGRGHKGARGGHCCVCGPGTVSAARVLTACSVMHKEGSQCESLAPFRPSVCSLPCRGCRSTHSYFAVSPSMCSQIRAAGLSVTCRDSFRAFAVPWWLPIVPHGTLPLRASRLRRGRFPPHRTQLQQHVRSLIHNPCQVLKEGREKTDSEGRKARNVRNFAVARANTAAMEWYEPESV